MSKVQNFITIQQETEIIDAIRTAEDNTSGEIRVHLEAKSRSKPFDRATEVFGTLNMNTQLKNGVLIYIAVEDKSVVIIGDKGINEVVEADFWESTKNTIVDNFSKGKIKQGLIEGVLKAGEELKKYFPFQKGDINELSDDISTN